MKSRPAATIATMAFAFAIAMITSPAWSGEARRGGRGGEAGEVNPNKPPQGKDDAEKKILAVLNEMWNNRDLRYLSVSEDDGRLFRQVTEMVNAKTVVEVGTSTGYSGLWFAMGLQKTGGKLITHEIDPGRVKMAGENFKKAGVADIVTIVEGDAHETVKKIEGPIDVLFLDADKEGYIDYFNKLLPKIRPGGVILAHNMRRPRPDPRFVAAITEDPNLDTSFLLMEGSGVTLTLKKR